MSDDSTATITVVDHLLAAGLSLERAEEHLRAGRVEVNGELVTTPTGLRLRRRGWCWSPGDEPPGGAPPTSPVRARRPVDFRRAVLPYRP